MLKDKEFYKDKKVLVRVDYNVPIKDGIVLDDNRIKQSLETINYLIGAGAKVILMSHLGRINSEENKLNNSLKPVAGTLKGLIDKPIKFCSYTRGIELENMINNLNSGEILLIENTRFEDYPNKLESSCDKELSKYWASLADAFVMEAFGSVHRSHVSTYGIPSIIGGNTGFLVDRELRELNEILNNKNKVIILGGKKVEDKLGVVENLVVQSKKIFLGGCMCFTFLKAGGYNISPSLVQNEYLEKVKNLLDKFNDKIILPLDIKTENEVKDVNALDENDIGFDIGAGTIEYYKSLINKDDLVVWNGPMGKFENKEYENGTKELLEYLSNNKIKTIICGGDTGGAAKKYNLDFYYISTGGGASLEYLEGKEFECLKVLE